MSEELDNNMNEINNTQDINKKTYRKKENLVEKYQYKNVENFELISDRSDIPLVKKDENMHDDNFVNDVNKLDTKIKNDIIIKSNKELYESYIKDLKYFLLSLNGDIIYDSSIDKSKNVPVKFENDFFILYGKKYSYNGLKIQKINLK